MSVNPGFGGQSFIPSVLQKIAALREMIGSAATGTRIEVDGGVGADNIQELQRNGADIFVAGSAVFDGQDPADRARKLAGLLTQPSTAR